jgi:hypothetical protein
LWDVKEMCKVKWKEYEYYTSSTHYVQKAGEGVLITFVGLNNDAVGIVMVDKSFLSIPRVFLEFIDWTK